ncbi:aspartyl/asparaginyl beta-hydroxylase domain-containing protein [Gloeobacter morelensis]|uniref:aspartyl/asparaginyl beta-hydroxylase domain-containing protein n=1 Tax=Gloeobacter morelensis TaxID=2907343 RepID=UPI001E5EF9A7|nr:aspartyl/asparaginyl beta-hydroxylase domain-containing protein [Gloeobacter morelensis]
MAGSTKLYYDAGQFEFVAQLETHWQTIRQELEHLGDGDFIAWPEKYLYGQGWDIFGLYAFGIKVGANCKLCPETTRLIEQIPGLVSAGFSSLKPGTHIAPHTGYPDGLLRCHLGLIVPDGSALRVGEAVRSWREGCCLVFDDTTEHEAWNQGSFTRIVLLLDFKAPAGLLSVPVKPESKGLAALFGLLKKK